MSSLNAPTGAIATTTPTPRSRPGRCDRPEKLIIGGETCTRNDVKAKEQGHTEKTLNRGDKRGAPYLMVGGIKYRPDRRYDDWLLGQIQTRNPPMRRRRSPMNPK